MLATVFKGKLSFYDLYYMPAGTFQVLYNIAVERNNSEEGKNQLKSEALQDTLEGVI